MSRTIIKKQDERCQEIVSVLKKLSTAKELSDFSDVLLEEILEIDEPAYDYDWFTAWLIKMVNKTFGLSSLESDIILMYFGILDGYHDLKISDRYDKFLFDSTYLEDGTKLAHKYYLELKDKPEEYKAIKNNFTKKVHECVSSFAKSLQEEINNFYDATFDGLGKYLEERIDKNGEVSIVPIRCVLRNPAKNQYAPLTGRKIVHAIYSGYSSQRNRTNRLIQIYRRVAMFVFMLALYLMVIGK